MESFHSDGFTLLSFLLAMKKSPIFVHFFVKID